MTAWWWDSVGNVRGGVALGRGGRWDTVGNVDHGTALVTWDPLSDAPGAPKVKKSQEIVKNHILHKIEIP